MPSKSRSSSSTKSPPEHNGKSKTAKPEMASEELEWSYAEPQGNGGETHQMPRGEAGVLTTQQGIPVADDQNSLRVGGRGPALLEDFHFREKIFHFDHERIPERVVHARGYGAHGYLREL